MLDELQAADVRIGAACAASEPCAYRTVPGSLLPRPSALLMAKLAANDTREDAASAKATMERLMGMKSSKPQSDSTGIATNRKESARASEEPSPKRVRIASEPTAPRRLARPAAKKAVPTESPRGADIFAPPRSPRTLRSSGTTKNPREEGEAQHGVELADAVDPDSPARNTRSRARPAKSTTTTEAPESPRRTTGNGKKSAKAAAAANGQVMAKRTRGQPPRENADESTKRTAVTTEQNQATPEPSGREAPPPIEDGVASHNSVPEDDDREEESTSSESAELAYSCLGCGSYWNEIRKAIKAIEEKRAKPTAGSEQVETLLQTLEASKDLCTTRQKQTIEAHPALPDNERQLQRALRKIKKAVSQLHLEKEEEGIDSEDEEGKREREERRKRNITLYTDAYTRVIPSMVALVEAILVSHYDGDLNDTGLSRLDEAITSTIALCDKAFHWKPDPAKAGGRPYIAGKARGETKNTIKKNLEWVNAEYAGELADRKLEQCTATNEERNQRFQRERQQRREQEAEKRRAVLLESRRLWHEAVDVRIAQNARIRAPAPSRVSTQRFLADQRSILRDITADVSSDEESSHERSKPRHDQDGQHAKGSRTEAHVVPDVVDWSGVETAALADGLRETRDSGNDFSV